MLGRRARLKVLKSRRVSVQYIRNSRIIESKWWQANRIRGTSQLCFSNTPQICVNSDYRSIERRLSPCAAVKFKEVSYSAWTMFAWNKIMEEIICITMSAEKIGSLKNCIMKLFCLCQSEKTNWSLLKTFEACNKYVILIIDMKQDLVLSWQVQGEFVIIEAKHRFL